MKRSKKENNMSVSATRKNLVKQRALLIWAAVFMVYGLVFYYIPLGGWVMAFQNYKPKTGLLHSKFVGLGKFQFLFEDQTFLKVIRNTLGMGILNLVCTFVMAILFAILLNEVRSRLAKKTIQTISYLPHFLSWIIVTGILHDALSANGIINELLVKAHIISSPISFFSVPELFWPIVAFANIWKETGWNAIIYLAAITSIDPSLYEAAAIDGATKMQQIGKVTLPMLKPTVITLTLMSIGRIFYSDFGLFYQVPQNSGALFSVTQTIDTYVYRGLMELNDVGMSAAAGVYQSIVGFILVLLANAIVRKVDSDNALF